MMTARFAPGLVLVLLLPSCGIFSYELSRMERDSPVPPGVENILKPGHDRIRRVLEQLGPPDRVSFRWTRGGKRITRIEYIHTRQRHSEMAFHIPRSEVSAYNTGVGFFLTYLKALSGESITPAELEAFPLTTPSGSDRPHRRKRLSHHSPDGRAVRMSRLRSSPQEALPPWQGPAAPLRALTLEGTLRGVDLLRLEFDEWGLLVHVEARRGIPDTGLAGQVRESILW